MKEITINCVGLADHAAFHALLAKNLGFEAHYGHNLDALYDCLTEIGQETHVTFYGLDTLAFADDFRQTLLDAEADNFWLQLSFE